MSIRALAFALLAASSIAAAASPKKPHAKSTPTTDASQPSDASTPTDAIDVDAMARAKDADGSTPAPADAPPQSGASTGDSKAPSEPASAAEPPATSAEPVMPAPSDSPATGSAAATVGTADPAMPAAAPTLPAGMAPAAPEAMSIAASCESRASGLLDQAAKADYASVTRDFDAKMRTELPPAKFKQQWESLGQFGKFVARGQSHLGSGQGYTLVMIPLIFDKANLVAQIACGSDGRIAGFHVNQAPKPEF